MVSSVGEFWVLEIYWFSEWLWNVANGGRCNFAILHEVPLQMIFSLASNMIHFVTFKKMGIDSGLKKV